MSPATTYGIYHAREARLESIHAFRYLAEQHLDRILEEDQSAQWADFAIGTMEQIIDWMAEDIKQEVFGCYNGRNDLSLC